MKLVAILASFLCGFGNFNWLNTQQPQGSQASSSAAATQLLQKVLSSAGWAQDWTKNPIKLSASVAVSDGSSTTALQSQFNAEYVGSQKIKTIFTATGATTILNGTDAVVVSNSAYQHVSAEALADLSSFLPFFSSNLNLSDTTLTFSVQGVDTIEGKAATVIIVHRNAISDQSTASGNTPPVQVYTDVPDPKIWIATDTSLPIRIEAPRRAEGVSATYMTFVRDFSNYQMISGVAVPFTIQESIGGTVIKTYSISDITFGATISDSDFTISN
jgi:hypothetical protein